jgi:hypothetical protein
VVADFSKTGTVHVIFGTVMTKKFDEKKTESVESDFFQSVEFLNTGLMEMIGTPLFLA